MAVMASIGLLHLPVLQNDELVGVVSIGDMVRSVIGDQNFSIEQYEHYIHGDR
jgi:IMP dehydrogenase